jgi:cation diffusion facilitator CzcD-associated flavoprotein CzcO
VSTQGRSVIVIGAGPAGLATSRELRHRGIDHVVLERGTAVGHAWRSLYDSLRLHTGKHMSALPGMAFPAATPLFPSRSDFVDYLERYALTFRLPVQTATAVTRVEPVGEGWRVTTAHGELSARALVVATGILSNPYLPDIPGRGSFRGTLMHSVAYRRPDPFRDRRVLVIGLGNSAGEIGSELARSGARVTLSIRSGAAVLPRQMFGIPIQYFSLLTSWLPKRSQRALLNLNGTAMQLLRGKPVLPRPPFDPCRNVPLIGFELVEAIREGHVQARGSVTALTPDGARFADGSEEPFDDVILATGFRAALGILEGVVSPDDCGFGRRRKRVRSAEWPNLFFVGHNYDARGGLFNIAQDSRAAGRLIAASLA